MVRDNNGNPVAGAKVFDATYGGNPAVTDANGGYRLAQRQPGTHNLCADGSAAPVSPPDRTATSTSAGSPTYR